MKARKKHSENTREMEIIEGRGGEEAGESRGFFAQECQSFAKIFY